MPSRAVLTGARALIKRIALAFGLLLLTAAEADRRDPSGCFDDGKGLVLCIKHRAATTYLVRIPSLELTVDTTATTSALRVLSGRNRPEAPLFFEAAFSAAFDSANVKIGPVATKVVRIGKQDAEARARAASPATIARLLERFGEDRSVAVLLDGVVRRELRRLGDAELAYRAEHGTYTSNLEELGWRSDVPTAEGGGVAGPRNLVKLQYAYAATVSGEPGLPQKFTIKAVGATPPTKGRVYSIRGRGPDAGQVVLQNAGAAEFKRDREPAQSPVGQSDAIPEFERDQPYETGDKFGTEQL